MKILVFILAILMAVCIVACAPDAPAGIAKENTVTQVGPVETNNGQSAARCGWSGECLGLM